MRSLIALSIFAACCASRASPIDNSVVPIALTLSVLPTKEILKTGEVFRIILKNTNDFAVKLDRRCLWPSIAVDVRFTSGQQLSRVLPPAPTPTFRKEYSWTIRPNEAMSFGISPSEFLNKYSFGTVTSQSTGNGGLREVQIRLDYAIRNLRAIGVDPEVYPKDMGIWTGEAKSNVISMPLARLKELFILELKAKGMNESDTIRYWNF